MLLEPSSGWLLSKFVSARESKEGAATEGSYARNSQNETLFSPTTPSNRRLKVSTRKTATKNHLFHFPSYNSEAVSSLLNYALSDFFCTSTFRDITSYKSHFSSLFSETCSIYPIFIYPGKYCHNSSE
jgi:hypothetical protein